jgi:hypothetical protein
MKVFVNLSRLQWWLSPEEGVETAVHPIPAGACLLDTEIELQGQLVSTRGGGATWRCSNDFPMNGSPFCPSLHVRGRGSVRTHLLEEEWPSSDEGHWIELRRKPGYEGRPFRLHVQFERPPEDLTRRADRWAALRGVTGMARGELLHQGNLKVVPLEEQEPNPRWEGLWNPLRALLNHQFVPAPEAIRVDFAALIRATQEVWVVSPDHLTEPLRLTSGWWSIDHPVPSGGVD